MIKTAIEHTTEALWKQKLGSNPDFSSQLGQNTKQVQSDLINFSNGWLLSSLHKTPLGYRAVIEKDVPQNFYPHWLTRYKAGSGLTQREAVNAALKSKGYVWEDAEHGTREHKR